MSNRLNALNNRRTALAITGLLFAIAVIGSQPTFGSSSLIGDAASPPPNTPDIADAQKGPKTEAGVAGPIVGQAARFDVSAPLRSVAPIKPAPVPDRGERAEANENPLLPGFYNSKWVRDPVVQQLFGPFTMPTPIRNFEGMYNYWGVVPPDTNGEAGSNHYVQIVNNGFQIFNKAGASLYGPANTNTLWTGFGGPCETRNDGDPIVLYDQLANRWNISQFTSAAPYYQCIALSTSGDPLGSYYRYAFFESNTVFGDYPHLGVWPDGYYMTVNQFGGGSGGGNYVFERPAMLTGDPSARFVYFSTATGGSLPSDLDGSASPPAGSPNFFLFPTNSVAGTLAEYKFHVDWTNTSLSTFTGPTNIAVAPWNSVVCTATRQQCIQQPNTTAQLEAIPDRFMFRLAYRNFGSHEAMVLNQTVNISSTTPGLAGIRWYEIRQPMTPTLFQQGTYTQPDNVHRWMGSIAQDRVGNIALGFSASSSVISPSIRYAGRLVTDPAGQMAQGEHTLIQGQGVEDFPGTARWGDYSDMTIDPSDDCTFWYTTEYFATKGDRNWRTRIGAFSFPNCTPGATTPTATTIPTHTPTVTPTVCPGGAVYNGVITLSDPTQAGRINRNNIPSTCLLPKTYPGAADANPRHYDVYTYTNSLGVSQCVNIRVVHNCGDNHLLTAAYLNSYNPNNLGLNYLGDMGRGGPEMAYSVDLPAGQSVVVVVHEGVANVGCATYAVSISPCAGVPTATQTRTPTPTATPTCVSVAYTAATGTATIIAGGSDVGNHCDDCLTNVNLPFPFTFYGDQYTSMLAGSNGTLQFTTGAGQPNIISPNCLPVSSANPPFPATIFAYYDDLRTDQGGGSGIFTQTLGTAPNRQFVVRWNTTYFNVAGTADFEVILNENTPNLSIIYGPSAELGLNGVSGVLRSLTVYTQFSCDTATLTNGLRVNYTAGLVPSCISPTPSATATPSRTHTGTPTNTPTTTRTFTVTNTRTNTATSTRTPTITLTPTATCPPGSITFVSMVNFAFVPSNVTINQGQTVRWTNDSVSIHTTTGNGGGWNSGNMSPGTFFDFTFNTAGTYPYRCVIHQPPMSGTITVLGGCLPTLTPTRTFTPTITGTPTSTPTRTNTPISTRILVGHVTWQGRPAQPNALQQLPITLTMKAGGTEFNYPSQNTDASGFFTVSINALVPGATYNWRVKGPDGVVKTLPTDPPGFLANSGAVLIVNTPQMNVEMGLMRAGDANNDNTVSISDFNILKSSFGFSAGHPNFDNRADFTGDLTVSVADFNLLKSSFGSSASPPLRPGAP